MMAADPLRHFYLILFPTHFRETIETALDEVGVSGYSRAPDVVGRGTRGPHFNNPTWPGATGEIFTVVEESCGHALMQRLSKLNASLQVESQGLYGLHVVTWPCQTLL